MTNLLKEDPWLIEQASKDNRLKLVRSVGPLSGGTRVKLVSYKDEDEIVVEAYGKQVNVTLDYLVIARKRYA